MSGKISAEMIPKRNILYLPVLSLSHNALLHRWSLQGQFFPKTAPGNYRKLIDLT